MLNPIALMWGDCFAMAPDTQAHTHHGQRPRPHQQAGHKGAPDRIFPALNQASCRDEGCYVRATRIALASRGRPHKGRRSRPKGLLSGTVIVSKPALGPAKPDPWDAGQFRVGSHALCWVHAERLVHKLVPATAEQRRAVEVTRALIWWFYADLKAWTRDPCPRRAAALRARFDRIFRRRTGYVVLDRLLARLHRRKDELLRVLWAQASLCPSSPTSRCTPTARRTTCAPA